MTQKDANTLINEFMDTHPKCASTWPMKNREAIRNLCKSPQLNEFFAEFLKWYDEQPKEESE